MESGTFKKEKRLRLYLSKIPTYKLLSRSGNSFFEKCEFFKKEFPLLLNRKWEFKWEL